jgi:hypothetical protein
MRSKLDRIVVIGDDLVVKSKKDPGLCFRNNKVVVVG